MDECVSSESSADFDASALSAGTPASPLTWREQIHSALSVVTVEPVLFIYMLATFMQYSVFQDLVYQKTCRENYNESVCHHLNDDHEALDIVQREASHWILGSTVALSIPSIIVANYLGS